MTERFLDRVDRILKTRDSLLCVGLDPDPQHLPAGRAGTRPGTRARRFLSEIVRATYPYAAAYKLQLGAYLAFGSEGLALLEPIVREIGPSRLRILDVKANDIANTMRLVRDGAFGALGFDAITVSPWLGWETLEPFTEDSSHGIFVVAHSSNPGAPDFQEIPTPRGPLWIAVIAEVRRMAAAHHNTGAVVGATYADAIRVAREALGDGIPILVPGIGAQGGLLSSTVQQGADGNGRALLINASRSILFAETGPRWAEAAGAEARRMREQINQLRSGVRTA
ncbi:MAG: orotidine-5'-phosphate decarboxylase [Thermoplasmata archaeon]|nr:orotidine-5'-phosphate decarboxylase [Thermoplasmata archaeon]